jgi:hypothetical protein
VLSTLRQERKSAIGASKQRVMGESDTQHTAAVEDSLDSTSAQPSRKDKADSGSGGQASDRSRGLSLRNIVPYAILSLFCWSR